MEWRRLRSVVLRRHCDAKRTEPGRFGARQRLWRGGEQAARRPILIPFAGERLPLYGEAIPSRRGHRLRPAIWSLMRVQ